MWDDQAIIAGTEWRSEISQHLESASIILLLISPDSSDFTASEDHISTEIQLAINRHIAGKAHVVPILLRSTYLGEEADKLPINKLKFLPTNKQPIAKWSHPEEAFVDVVKEIRKAVEHLKAQSQQRKSALFGYEMQGGSSSTLWNDPSQFTPNDDYQEWLKEKRAFIAKEITTNTTTWLKAGDHGYAFTVQFLQDGKLLEFPLLDQSNPLQGSWEILGSGILRINMKQEEGGGLAKYELDVYANQQGQMHSGIEFRNNMSTPRAYFVFLPLQQSDTGKYLEKALIAFNQLLLVNPDCVEAHNAKGDILRQLKYYEEALGAYQRVTELNNGHGWAWYNMREVLRELRRFEEALNAYGRSTELNPTFMWAWYNMGKVLYELSRREEAIVAYEQAQRLKPDFANLYAHKGDAFYCLLRYKEALDAYEQALHLGYHFSDSFRYEIVKGLGVLGVIEVASLQHDT